MYNYENHYQATPKMIIIGGPHQGMDYENNLPIGASIELPVATSIMDSPPKGPPKPVDFSVAHYTVRKFKTGNPKDNICYIAPFDWDNTRCFTHLLNMVKG